MRRHLVAALVCFALAGVAASASCDGLELGLAVASGADLVSTMAFLQTTDLQEGNPFAPSSVGGMVAVKVVGTAALICLYRVIRGRDALAAKVLAVVGIVAFSVATGWNVYQMRETG